MTLPAILTSSLQKKLLSLLLAFLLWLFVALEAVDQLEIPLAISYDHVPAGLLVKTVDLPGLSIRIEGPRILLLRQILKGTSVILDLSGAREGSAVYSDFERSVSLINGLKPLALSPAKIELTLYRANNN